MIKHSAQYTARDEKERGLLLKKLSVTTSVRRFLELVQTGWSLIKAQPRPMPISLAKLIAPKS